MEEKSIRLEYLDICKVIGIILVVFGHFLPYGHIAKVMIYSFHVPFFLIISGAVLKAKYSTKEFFIKRTKQLLIPYFVYTIISLPEYFISVKSSVIDIGKGILFLYGDVIWNSPLWFLVVLFEVEIVFYLILRLSKSKTRLLAISAIISIIACYLIYRYGIRCYFGFEKLTLLYPFYTLGYILRHSSNFFCITYTKSNMVLSAVCFLINLLIVIIFNSSSNISILGFDLNNLWLLILSSSTESLSLIYLIKGLKNNSFFRLFSKYTLEIMCTHYILMARWNSIFNSQSLLLAVFGTITLIIIYYLIFLLLEKMRVKTFR